MIAQTLSAIAGVPVICAATQQSVAGYDASGIWDGNEIILSPEVCGGLANIRLRIVTDGSLEAVMVLSHEMAHASGRDLTTEAALSTNGDFQGETARIENDYELPPASAAREAGADCAAARTISAVAYTLGLRAPRAFTALRAVALIGTYTSVPAVCFSG